jgi:SAM-dependent methyltransferase
MSLRKLIARIRRAFRGTPRTARDLVLDYAEYLRLQRETYLSHESEVERWASGQRRFVETAFAPLSRAFRVLDCACGDGVALEALRAMGFQDLAGVEIAPEKASRARALGFRVEEADMHDLSAFAVGSFDAIISSHTLEHAYDPGRALAELRRLLVPGGRLFVVLPFPDTSERNDLAHVGKYDLGTHREDGGEAASRFFVERGFEVVSRRLDDFREPELWLFLRAGAGRT